MPGAVAPVVYGGKVRAVMVYLDRAKLQARHLSPLDVMKAVDNYNVFLPTGDAKFGDTDYALDSNSMYELVERMGDIPLRTEHGNAAYLRDVAHAQGRQLHPDQHRPRRTAAGRSTSPSSASSAPARSRWSTRSRRRSTDMKARLTRPGDRPEGGDGPVGLRPAVDREPGQEGVLGAVLCSLVILLFLGEWRMTVIAVMTLPISVLAAIVCLYATGNTINVMTLAGLALAIGPMVDSAIICLENTHRHLGLGASPEEAAYLGRQRGRPARAGLDALHVPGARPAGPDARPGRVPLQADGAGRGVRDDRGLHPVADLRPLPQRHLAEAARRPRRRPRPRRTATATTWRRRIGANGNGPAAATR